MPAVVPSSSAMPGGFGSSTTPAAQPPALAEPTSTQFEVDPNLPTTSLQIRLGDGTRFVRFLPPAHPFIQFVDDETNKG